MFIRPIAEYGVTRMRLLVPNAIFAHSMTCPTRKQKGVCPGAGDKGKIGDGSGATKKIDFKRAEKSGPCRMGFIPEEWFLFFHSKTGVSGPYIFGIAMTNYLLSKEIYIMEHEYYSGLSIAIILYLVATKLGPQIGASLDKEVDETVASWEKGRKDEIAFYEKDIKMAKDSQWRAEGQKLLMDAKKENIAMQLEAVYRERAMHAYHAVRGRMDYHVKKHRAEARIHQKWMIGWVLENVQKSITPEFQKQALDHAIQDLAAAASRAK